MTNAGWRRSGSAIGVALGVLIACGSDGSDADRRASGGTGASSAAGGSPGGASATTGGADPGGTSAGGASSGGVGTGGSGAGTSGGGVSPSGGSGGSGGTGGTGGTGTAGAAAGGSVAGGSSSGGTGSGGGGVATTDGGLATNAQVVSPGSNNATDPDIAISDDGDVRVVFEQFVAGGDWIWTARYSEATGWEPPAPMDDTEATVAALPRVGVDSSGNALSVWLQSGTPYQNNWASQALSGQSWASPAVIDDHDAGNTNAPELAVSSGGTAFAVWYQSTGSQRHVVACRFANPGGWGTPEPIDTDAGETAAFPHVAVNASGNAVVVWEQTGGGFRTVWASHYSASGGTWSTPEPIDAPADAAGYTRNVRVGMDASGNAVAVWHEWDGTRENMWGNTFAAGGSWGAATLLETSDAGTVGQNSGVVVENGAAFASWTQSDGTRNRVWVNRYVFGVGWAGATGLDTDTEAEGGFPRLAMTPTGDAVAVWHRRAAENWVVARRFTPADGWAPATIVGAPDQVSQLSALALDVNASGQAAAAWEARDGTWLGIWTAMVD